MIQIQGKKSLCTALELKRFTPAVGGGIAISAQPRSHATRQQRLQSSSGMIEESTGSKFLSDLYEGGMSVVDMAVEQLATGGISSIKSLAKGWARLSSTSATISRKRL